MNSRMALHVIYELNSRNLVLSNIAQFVYDNLSVERVRVYFVTQSCKIYSVNKCD